MLKMNDLPYPPIGNPAVELVLSDDLLLSDKDFSDKPDAIASVGDRIKISSWPNFGLVKHEKHGSFRY